MPMLIRSSFYGDGDLTGQTSGSLVKQLDMLQEVAGIDIRGMLNGALMHQAGNQPVVDAIKDQHAAAPKPPAEATMAPKRKPLMMTQNRHLRGWQKRISNL